MNATVTPRLRRLRHERGQSMVEFAMVLPFLLVIVLGVVEVGYALLDQHVVTKLAREGANLISRDATLQEAETALRSMSGRPINFADGSKVIFSVLKQGATTGTSNYGQMILYARHEFGNLGAASHVLTSGGGGYGGPPYYEAANSDNNTGSAGDQPAQQPDFGAGRLPLRRRSVHAPRAHHAVRPVRRRRADDALLGRLLLGHGRGSPRITDMTTQTSRVRSEKGFTLVYMAVGLTTMLLFAGLADRLRPRVCRQGAAQQGRGRRGARRGAHAEQRRPPGRGGEDLPGRTFPLGFMGTTSVTDPVVAGFFTLADRRGQRPSTS